MQNPYTLHIHIQIYFIIHFAGNNQIFRKFSAVFSQTGTESRNVTQTEQQKYASVLHKLKLKNVLTQVLEYLISSISGQYLESVGCVLLIFSVFLLQLLNTTCCLYCWHMWLRVSKKPKETRFLLAPEPEMRGPWEIQVPVVHFSSSDQVILWRHLLPYFLADSQQVSFGRSVGILQVGQRCVLFCFHLDRCKEQSKREEREIGVSARRITQYNWLPLVWVLQYSEKWCCASSTRWQKMNWQVKNNMNLYLILIW